jgi:hypothetical protein
MKRKDFYLVLTTIALTLFSSCSENTISNEKETGNLSVVATRGNVTYSASSAEDIVIFTGDDIETYNGKSGRIVFKDLTYDDLFQRTDNNFRLKFYLEDEFLFGIILLSEPVNITYDVPILTASRGDENVPDKFFLLDSDPRLLEKTPAWDKFIRYLIDAGKLTEAADIITPPVPKVPDETVTAISAEDIQSYNLSTKEIVFAGFTVNDILEGRIGIKFGVTDGFNMPFYLGETLLFEAKCVSPLSNIPYNALTLTWLDDKFYLSACYPFDSSKELTQKAKWDAFVEYLNSAGKIVQ